MSYYPNSDPASVGPPGSLPPQGVPQQGDFPAPQMGGGYNPQKDMICNLDISNFVGGVANGAFLNQDLRCHICQRFAGQHPKAQNSDLSSKKHPHEDTGGNQYHIDHVFILGDDMPNQLGEINGAHSTCCAIGPDLVLACAHSLSPWWVRVEVAPVDDCNKAKTRKKNGKKRGGEPEVEEVVWQKNLNNKYWIKKKIVHSRTSVNQSATTITDTVPIRLVAYHANNDWALFIRTDGDLFESWAEIDLRLGEYPSEPASIKYQDICVYHCPVVLLNQAIENGCEYTLECQIHKDMIQSQTEHHLRYAGSGTSRGSSGGALHMSGCPRMLGWHCDAITENSFTNAFSLPEVCMEEDDFHRRSETAVFPVCAAPVPSQGDRAPPRKKPNLDDVERLSEAAASAAGGNNSQGTSSIVSRHPRLMHYIRYYNSEDSWQLKQSVQQHKHQFVTIAQDGLVSHPAAMMLFGTGQLSAATLTAIWALSDIDTDGFLDLHEFVVATHLVDMAKQGHPVPAALETQMIPPGK